MAWYVEQERFGPPGKHEMGVLNVVPMKNSSPDLQQEILGDLDRNDPALTAFIFPR